MKQALIALVAFSLICCARGLASAEEDKAPDKAIELKSSASQKMWVTFDYASHDGIGCEVCHHAAPSDATSKYVSCGASEQCHYRKGSRERDVQSVFWAYHTKSAERSCYGCRNTMVQKSCRPCT